MNKKFIVFCLIVMVNMPVCNVAMSGESLVNFVVGAMSSICWSGCGACHLCSDLHDIKKLEVKQSHFIDVANKSLDSHSRGMQALVSNAKFIAFNIDFFEAYSNNNFDQKEKGVGVAQGAIME